LAEILNQQVLKLRSQIDELIKELHDLIREIDHEELDKTVSDLRNRINEPFMFVIVGEVKSGKSSFINALLDTGREITKVAPQPMTDTIQQILYGEKEEIITLNPFLKKITIPVDILKEIAIVDTPGTNTIIEHHQEITERFIPASDLIVFVFEAKNPYRQSAWAFFEYIRSDWRKKIIFVLQQKDLMPEEDLKINEQGVRDYAVKQGIDDPIVFSVSAKMEQEGQKKESGFRAVQEYIQQNITGGKAPILKLKNNLDITRNISERLAKGLSIRRQQWEADLDFRADIKETLTTQTEQSKRQVDVLVENLLAGYTRITNEKEAELNRGLSFFSLLRRSLAGIFSKHASAKEWLSGLAGSLEKDLESELQQKLKTGVSDLAENIQSMVKMIDLKISNSQTILKNDHAIFSTIADRRSNILRELQEAFDQFMSGAENFTSRELFSDQSPVSPNLLTGSGIAVIGAIITTVTQLTVFDITGGVLTAVGIIFAGVSTSVRKRRIMKGFRDEVDKGRQRMESELTDKLKLYVGNLQEKIDGQFDSFDGMLEKEKGQLEQLENAQQEIDQRLDQMEESLREMLP
jgi:ribosome biogenesis GTPase A